MIIEKLTAFIANINGLIVIIKITLQKAIDKVCIRSIYPI
jgi:hypothetical protein